MTGNSYNRKFGENPNATRLLEILDLTRDDFGRYRDAYLTDRGTSITVYTRMGGNCRPFFADKFKRLGMHPQITTAFDDAQDSTYHYIKFLVPTDWLNETKRMYREQGEPKSVWQKFRTLDKIMAELGPEGMEKDPRFADEVKLLKDAQASGAKWIDTTDDDMPKELKPEFLR